MKSFRKQSGNFPKSIKVSEIINSKLISKVFSQILTKSQSNYGKRYILKILLADRLNSDK